MISSSERRLNRAIEKYGAKDPYVQMMRDQMAAQQSGKSAQETYVIGMMKRQPDGGAKEKQPEAAEGYAEGGLVTRYDPAAIDQIVNRVRGSTRV